ncbi:Tm-1-like ATP-binding domain-containing protein [Salinithrix halophila]|uniref:Tm-1-like ATP-binding domain-containing protein n=1 Tax=Salinithrix halophila TaxID=1485204 RepID=A0ABV8JJ27_9BACL
MSKTVAVIGALDTKGKDYAYVKQEIEKRGHKAFVIDTGILGEPHFRPDISAEEVAKASGVELRELKEKGDKSLAMSVMTRGIALIMRDLYQEGVIDAGISMGGSNGTVIGTAALRELPLGAPKVMVSTVASGDTQPYVGITDVVMFPSILDVSGVNMFSARIYANAVGALVGMLETEPPPKVGKSLITASMFGNTTTSVNQCKDSLEKNGYEVLVFHATGTGGRTMETLVREGYITGMLDITTTELADELVGGVLSAGPQRMDAAAEWGIPQVAAPGCLDMVNFWGLDTVPEDLRDRILYQWNPNITLIRTTPEENEALGRIFAEKVNRSTGPTAVFLPLKGISALDAPGKEFWWPEADEALFDSIKRHIRKDLPIYELDLNINDQAFSDAMADKLLELIAEDSE